MKPVFKISANTADITRIIKKHLVSLSVRDSLGLDSDTLDIVLDDKDQVLKWPKKGVVLELKLGFDNVLFSKGAFVVDELDHSGDPETLTIHCKAADIAKLNRMKHTRHWQDATLGSVCTEIAREHFLKLNIDKKAADVPLDHLYQVDETDLNFLARLSKSHNVLMQVKKNTLILSAITEGGGASSVVAGLVIDSGVPAVFKKARRYYYYRSYVGRAWRRQGYTYTYTLKTIVDLLGRRYGFIVSIDDALNKIKIAYEIQNRETDFVFYSRIAKKYKISIEIKNNVLTAKKATKRTSKNPPAQKSPSGNPLATVTIDRAEVNRPSYLERHTDEYDGCIARYIKKHCYSFFGHSYCYGSKTIDIKRGKVGDDWRVKDFGTLKDEAAAKKAVDDFYNNMSGSSSLTLPMPVARPEIMVGQRVLLTGGFIDRVKEQRWMCTEASLSLGSGLSGSVKLVRDVEFVTLEKK